MSALVEALKKAADESDHQRLTIVERLIVEIPDAEQMILAKNADGSWRYSSPQLAAAAEVNGFKIDPSSISKFRRGRELVEAAKAAVKTQKRVTKK
jgi:hypothetical protein